MLASMLMSLIRLFFKLSAGTEGYNKRARFTGIRGGVNCLSFSPGGRLLAGGGDDEAVRVWDIETKKCKDVLVDTSGRWGQITCLKWMHPYEQGEAPRLVFGTGRGFVVLHSYNQNKTAMVELSSLRVFPAGDSVEAIACDAATSRLAVSSHHGKVSMFEVGRYGTIKPLWSHDIDNIARSISFYEGGRNVLVFALESGEMICYNATTSKEEWRKVLKSGIGHASLCPDEQRLLVDNIAKGFDLYQLPRSSPSHKFTIPIRKACVKDGAFGERSAVIACGSDQGKVYIFSVSSSALVQTLRHSGWKTDVQTLTTVSTKDGHFIASGTSGETSEVVVWEKRASHRRQTTAPASRSAIITLLNWLSVIALLYWTADIWNPPLIQLRRRMALQTARQSYSASVRQVQPLSRANTVSIPSNRIYTTITATTVVTVPAAVPSSPWVYSNEDLASEGDGDNNFQDNED